ncbi:MAG TPA: hypothetical protein VIN04_01535 [Myxococcota bacterium]
MGTWIALSVAVLSAAVALLAGRAARSAAPEPAERGALARREDSSTRRRCARDRPL